MSKLLNKIKRLNNIMAIQEGISKDARIKLIEHNSKVEKLVEKLHLPCVTVPFCKGDYLLKDRCRKWGGICAKNHCDYWQNER